MEKDAAFTRINLRILANRKVENDMQVGLFLDTCAQAADLSG